MRVCDGDLRGASALLPFTMSGKERLSMVAGRPRYSQPSCFLAGFWRFETFSDGLLDPLESSNGPVVLHDDATRAQVGGFDHTRLHPKLGQIGADVHRYSVSETPTAGLDEGTSS
jgi:hypothetical protein